MTMLSFRTDDADAQAVQQWSERLGIDRSELLRDALRRQLIRLAGENDVNKWIDTPLSDTELVLGEIADWGPAEDWSDWADAAR